MNQFFKFQILIIILISLIACKEEDPLIEPIIQKCNGSELLCDKRYDEVTYLTTHNAYNYSDEPANFPLPNQTHSINQQLEDGVRAFMLDIYHPDQWQEDESPESIWLYHSFSLSGSKLFSEELLIFKEYLAANENEVITFILETYVSFELLKEVFDEADLTKYLYMPESNNSDWPTLKSMIENNQRLVIFTESADINADDWYLDMWAYTVETHFSNNVQTDFSCSYNRGDASTSLFVLNHFITDPIIGVGRIDSANIINQYNYLLNRIELCESETGKLPNFLAVDFYEQGNTMDIVDFLNN